MVKHIEAWDVAPGPVVRSLIRPSSRMPTNTWEAFMAAMDSGDAKGAWLAAARPLLKYYALPVVGASLLVKAVTGDGLPVGGHRMHAQPCSPGCLCLAAWHCIS